MTAQNGLIGEDYGTEIPRTQTNEQDLTIEKNMARFSKSKEFKKLKEHFEERIKYYQEFRPDGRAVEQAMDNSFEVALNWQVANAIIRELNAVLSVYETVKEAVEKNA